MSLIEHERRRPEFAGGTPIVLADGQEWFFPEVTLDHFRPRRLEDGSILWATRHSRGPDYDAFLDAWAEAETGTAQASALLEMALLLLGENYDLAFEEAAGLLIRVPQGLPRSEANAEMWERIREVATGQAPKPTPGGSESPS